MLQREVFRDLEALRRRSETNIAMFPVLSTCGGIKDLILGLEWNRTKLLDEVAQRAGVLADRGVGPGSIVAITHGGTARFFADLFAVWTVGATAACLDNTLTANEIRNIVDFAGATLVLVDEPTEIEGLKAPTLLLNGLGSQNNGVAASDFKPDNPALLLFTSGTTGIPKGVVLTYGAVLTRIKANIAAIGEDKLARALVTLPTFFGHGLIGNSLTPLLSGGTIVLHPRGMPLIDNLGKIIDEHEISFMSSVPSLWRLALTCSPPPAGKTLRRVHVGSAPLSAALWSEIAAWADAEVVNCYGITETANWIAGASSRDDGIADGLVGKMWGGNAGVMDDTGVIQSKGSGEVVINSSCLMSGYYKRPDLTSAAFSDGWFRTGDTGTIDENGRIWVTGRIKDEINRGGFKVQPAEIDTLLESHPAVAEACVFGIPDPMGGEAIAAAIRLNEGEKITSLGLQTWCGERLRRAAVPEHWFFVSEIPRTGRGKVSRENVRKLLVKDTDSHSLAKKPTKPAASLIVASSFIADPLLPLLRFALKASGLSLEARCAAHNQVLHELTSDSSLFATNIAGANVILLRFEDFVRDIDNASDAQGLLRQHLASFKHALATYANHVKVPTLLALFRPSPRVPKVLSQDVQSTTTDALAFARATPGLIVIAADDIGRAQGADIYDKVGDQFANMPFTEAYHASIVHAVVGKLIATDSFAEKARWPETIRDGQSLLNTFRTERAKSRTIPGEPTEPTTDTERMLLDLWQSVLGIDGIGVDDDFLALGGTSLMSARLFAEIAERFKVKLPLTAILRFPTVRTLAGRIDRELGRGAKDDGQASPSLVDLKSGGTKNFFFVHDGEGETLLYLNLAKRMPSDINVVGIEPHRLPRLPLAQASIEDMAKAYIADIRSRQARGPFMLGGMCAGGVIAYEMAAQLVRSGEKVELVALLDAPTPHAEKKRGRISERRLERLKGALNGPQQAGSGAIRDGIKIAATVTQKLTNAARYEVQRRLKNLSILARFFIMQKVLEGRRAWPSFIPELTAHQILNTAQARYRPAQLSAPPVVLVRAKYGEGNDTPYSQIYADEALGWRDFTTSLKIVDVEGGHSSMLQEAFVDSLANALSPLVSGKL